MVFENVFRYITLSFVESAKSVSVGLVDTENSDSKSSSIIRARADNDLFGRYLDAAIPRKITLNSFAEFGATEVGRFFKEQISVVGQHLSHRLTQYGKRKLGKVA